MVFNQVMRRVVVKVLADSSDALMNPSDAILLFFSIFRSCWFAS